MRRYLVHLSATFEVTAENVAQATHFAERIRSIGEAIGWSRSRGKWEVKCLEEHKTKPCQIGKREER